MASLFRAVSNFFREQKDNAAEAMSDPARDAKYDIIDAEKQIAEFESDIQRLMKENITRRKDLDDARDEVAKWSNIASKAAQAGNREDVEAAVTEKQSAESTCNTLQNEIARNDSTIATLRKQLGQARNRIAKAKSNQASLAARVSGGKLRANLAKSASGLDGGPLSRLDNLERAARDAESDAEAWETLQESNSESLTEKYGSGDADVDDEVARLMAAQSKPAED